MTSATSGRPFAARRDRFLSGFIASGLSMWGAELVIENMHGLELAGFLWNVYKGIVEYY